MDEFSNLELTLTLIWMWPNPNLTLIKVGCVFAMVIVYKLPHAKFGRNDYREDRPHFNNGSLSDFETHPNPIFQVNALPLIKTYY